MVAREQPYIKFKVIGSDRKLHNFPQLHLTVMDKKINSENHVKCLGVTVSSNMTWLDHIESISSTINQSLCLLFWIKHLLWGDKKNKVPMNTLQAFQNKSLRSSASASFYRSKLEDFTITVCIFLNVSMVILVIIYPWLKRKKSNVRLPLVKTNWGKQSLGYHAEYEYQTFQQYFIFCKSFF